MICYSFFREKISIPKKFYLIIANITDINFMPCLLYTSKRLTAVPIDIVPIMAIDSGFCSSDPISEENSNGTIAKIVAVSYTHLHGEVKGG